MNYARKWYQFMQNNTILQSGLYNFNFSVLKYVKKYRIICICQKKVVPLHCN